MNDWWQRDVFVLKNGRKVVLRKLREGQVVRVLSVTESASRTKPPVWEEAKNLNPEWAGGVTGVGRALSRNQATLSTCKNGILGTRNDYPSVGPEPKGQLSQ